MIAAKSPCGRPLNSRRNSCSFPGQSRVEQGATDADRDTGGGAAFADEFRSPMGSA